MTFRGFDIERLGQLSTHLSELSGGAHDLHRELREVLREAGEHLDNEPATRDPALSNVLGWGGIGGLFSAYVSLPGSLAGSLERTAGEIDRRREQIDGCRDLADAGYRIPDRLLFADEDPPNAEDIEEALTALEGLDGQDFGSNGNRDELERIMSQLDGLTAVELDLFVAKVPPADLERYNDLLTDEETGFWSLITREQNGIPEDQRRDHLSGLLAAVDKRNLDKLVNAFPWVQPDFTSTDAYLMGENSQNGESANGMRWGVPTDPLFAPDGTGAFVSAADISQGRFGDCWYIASLTAITQTDPQFIQDGLRQNPNGTVDVRIWDEHGNLRWVTVTPELPMDENGNPMSAYGNGETWPAYYEKAFALMYGEDQGGAPDGYQDDPAFDRAERGTYGAIEWDFTEQAPPYLTGNESESIGDGFSDMRDAFNSGQPVIVATGTDGDDIPEEWGNSFSTRHVYYVKGFEDGKVILGNPWGDRYPPLEVTEEQYERYFNSAQALTVPK
ncbi:C2 family cysteine protease [Streptomyces harbinensis]|uniref:C2 family cysteine protease n=1 Tax=Streptomyces harbinensis TaxID=1176198 RepID=UPI0036821345